MEGIERAGGDCEPQTRAKAEEMIGSSSNKRGLIASSTFKRKEAVMLSTDWIPGAGIPCYSFGPVEQRQQNERLFRTSLLFRELEVAYISFGLFSFVM